MGAVFSAPSADSTDAVRAPAMTEAWVPPSASLATSAQLPANMARPCQAPEATPLQPPASIQAATMRTFQPPRHMHLLQHQCAPADSRKRQSGHEEGFLCHRCPHPPSVCVCKAVRTRIDGALPASPPPGRPRTSCPPAHRHPLPAGLICRSARHTRRETRTENASQMALHQV